MIPADRFRCFMQSAADGEDRLEISRGDPAGGLDADTVAITVRQVAERLIIQSATLLRVGQQGSALLQAPDGRVITGVAWSSSDPAVVSVGADGVYWALAPGFAVIRGERNGRAFEFGVSAY